MGINEKITNGIGSGTIYNSFVIINEQGEIKKSKNKFPIAIGLTTLLTTSTISKAEKIDNKPQQSYTQHKLVDKTKIESANIRQNNKIDTLFISGNIQSFDSNKKENIPVYYATIIVKGSRNGVLTIDNGDFKLRYLPHINSGKIYLVISSVGLVTKEVEFIFNGQKKIYLGTITLDKYQGEITEFWVTTKKRSKLSRFWRRITKPFRR